ncbi:MAG: hypothetical protein ABW224_03675 [Kibdelosporangium sp.]
MDLQERDQLYIHQKLSLSFRRYQVFLGNGAGKADEDHVVAFIEQDKSSFKDKVVIYTDADKSQVLAEVKARKLIDLAAGFDVVTPDGEQIGGFKKEVGKSLMRTTWTLEQEGEAPITVIERSKPVAISRRLWTFLPVVGEFPFPMRFHFDFVRDGAVVGGVDKTHRLSDNYLAWTDQPKLDRRLLIAMGVALDFRQGR